MEENGFRLKKRRILPCTCGYPHINLISNHTQSKYWISDCAKCGMIGTVLSYVSSEEEAVSEWDNRIEREGGVMLYKSN